MTKAWSTECGYDQILRACESSQRRLDLETVDLYLLHWPVPDLIAESWRAMERVLKENRVRTIGVSNFCISDRELVLSSAEVHPACNQIENHAYFSQPEVRTFCQERNIQVVSYSPLGTGTRSDVPRTSKPVADPVITEIAKQHEVTPAQAMAAHKEMPERPLARQKSASWGSLLFVSTTKISRRSSSVVLLDDQVDIDVDVHLCVVGLLETAAGGMSMMPDR